MMELIKKFFNKDDLKNILHNFNVGFKKDISGAHYYNAPSAFDIETSSFIDNNGEKTSLMYIWQFGINGYCFYGRTWAEFFDFMDELKELLNLRKNRRLIIYVHNLQYEFQFIKNFFEWDNTLITEKRRVLKAVSNDGFEFRDSYILTGLSLEKSAEELTKYKIKKLTGNLDYTKIRTPETPLSRQELNYCLYDVLTLMAIIEEKRQQEKEDITKIPLTKTGYVRRFIKNKCLTKGKQYNDYNNFIKNLTIKEDEYKLLKEASAGGFVHCNPEHAGTTQKEITSFDLCSAYPSVLIAKKYPVSRGFKAIPKNEDEFYDLLKNYCCVFSITFYDLKSAVEFEHYLSVSRCRGIKGVIEDNGRIVEAERLTTTITGEDFEIINLFYDYSSYRLNDMYIYYKGYLPKVFIEGILDLYEKKTQLKGIKGREDDYLSNKGMLNSFYGLCIEDIVRERKTFLNGHYETQEEDLKKQLKEYNNKKGRFNSYTWGVFCSAYCRNIILKTIYNLGDDYIYSDTDSVKIMNYKKHLDYFEEYNKQITEELKNTLQFYDINVCRVKPKTKNGIEKPLGIFEKDEEYTRFKALKAKCYIYEKDGDFNFTISGLGKEAKEYFQKLNDPFKAFKSGLKVPKDFSGKQGIYYIETPRKGIVEDYRGNKYNYYEESGAYIENLEFEFSKNDDINKIENLIFSVMDK